MIAFAKILAVIAALAIVLHFRTLLFMRGPRGLAEPPPTDPTYWAILVAFSVFLAAMLTEISRMNSLPSGIDTHLGEALVVVAFAWTFWAKRHLGKNYAPTAQNDRPDQTIIHAGPYAYVRHPIYWGNLAVALGLIFAFRLTWTWITLAGLAAAIAWRIRREERFLRAKFGERFRDKPLT
ncbi:MAG: isoprenylcysteine carboxylmethyltransferase family protein [Deltaproteobacteria bacterium]|nr:isoprenylcysteine carboxylmethyltransferase family protein [Deltaproteobacteria bacterium]